MFFGQKFSGEKGITRWCNIIMNSQFFCRQSSGQILAYFHAFDLKVTVVCGIDSLASQDEFFVNNPLNVKENDEHSLDFALHLFQSALNRACHSDTCVWLMLLPRMNV
jgi:hypothetical protein